MENPWDIPPFPKRGDPFDDLTYAGVGRVMSQWETVEYRLAHLYSAFVGRPDDVSAIREYGAGTIFRQRIEALTRKAEAYFIKHSHHGRESEFAELLHGLSLFVERRNDVAHGIVGQIQLIGLLPVRWTPS